MIHCCIAFIYYVMYSCVTLFLYFFFVVLSIYLSYSNFQCNAIFGHNHIHCWWKWFPVHQCLRYAVTLNKSRNVRLSLLCITIFNGKWLINIRMRIKLWINDVLWYKKNIKYLIYCKGKVLTKHYILISCIKSIYYLFMVGFSLLLLIWGFNRNY